MDHLAILKKSRKLLQKIASGEKTIESRWYKFKRNPWNKIKLGETIYFKDSGEPVTFKAKVEKVLQFENLTLENVRKIIEKYGKAIGFTGKINYSNYADKKYCILLFLKNVEKVNPFQINKKGYGLMSAWICVEDIDKIIKKS